MYQEEQPKNNPKSNYLTKRAAAVIMAVCLVLFAGAGFAAGYAVSVFNGAGTEPEAGQTPVPDGPVRTPEGQGTGVNVPPAGTDSTGFSVSDIYKKVSATVVEISTETVTTGSFMQQYISRGAGSGVIVSSDGYIVTNNHVIEDANTIKVRLTSGKTYDAILIGTDKETDVALIKIDEKNLPSAEFGDSSRLIVGEPVVAIGNPLGSLGGTTTDGIISALDRQISIGGEVMTLLQTNAAINPGNSGGGLFNARGQLIGIVNAKSSGSDIEGIGFAIPINVAEKVITQLQQYGYVKGRIDIGMSLIDIYDTQTAWMYRVSKLGLYVSQVNRDSGAARAGLRAGDCILAVDGKEIVGKDEFKAVIKKHKVGDTVKITVYRGGKVGDLELVLEEYEPSGGGIAA